MRHTSWAHERRKLVDQPGPVQKKQRQEQQGEDAAAVG